LSRILWALSEKVSARAKAADLGGKVIQLKLKTADFKIVTRHHTLDGATQLARRIFDAGNDMLKAEAKGKRYRLIGIGLANLVPAEKCDDTDLFDQKGARRDAAERAMDKVRQKFGSSAIRKGRAL
jgi:DNA polymerase-4